ncbi:hypothetical protein RHGRI_016994 [Rhododendron griersonianum]|uniref:DUF4283 domain-containing protein n=1 Tax=Rhododendron griersonianum TaxID=479676 RepID=A0AAV6JW80_9ERIC|nr:hypothetical protein RHGRI_016994 [Rhododendron griersonianum]
MEGDLGDSSSSVPLLVLCLILPRSLSDCSSKALVFWLMDFATHFPVLRSSPLGRNPSLSPVSSKGLVFGSGDHGNIIDHLERVTVENTDHLCIDDTDGPTAKQIKSLNAEIQYLRKELESKTPIEAVLSTGVVSPKPTWTDVVTQDPSGPRMKLSFHPPQVKEARVVVCPPEDVVEAGIAKWNNCVVGYFLDKKLPFGAISNIAFRIWKKFGIQKVMSNEQGFFFFKFSQVDAHKRVIAAGPWLFGDKLLVLKPWTPQMELRKEQFAKVPIWVHLYQVPLVLWNAAGLSYIASAIGIPLYADALTESCERLSYARLCVEVEVGSVLPETVDVEYCGLTATVGVKYPWRPVKCLECHVFGHSDDQCVVKAKVTKPKTEWVRKGALTSIEEGSPPTEEVVITQLAPDLSMTVSEKSQGKRAVVTAATVSECVSPPVVEVV